MKSDDRKNDHYTLDASDAKHTRFVAIGIILFFLLIFIGACISEKYDPMWQQHDSYEPPFDSRGAFFNVTGPTTGIVK